MNFQYISGFPEHQRKAATVHQRSHCSAVVKLDCVSTHREEIMVEIRWKLGIIWREKDFLYSFSSYFMLRGKSQSDRKGNVERLLFLLLWENDGKMGLELGGVIWRSSSFSFWNLARGRYIWEVRGMSWAVTCLSMVVLRTLGGSLENILRTRLEDSILKKTQRVAPYGEQSCPWLLSVEGRCVLCQRF